MLDFIELTIEWIVDFVEFLWLPIVIVILYVIGKKQERKQRRLGGNGRQTYYTNQSEGYQYGHHSPGNDPDFNYMSHDDSDESNQKDYRTESYGYGDQISPFERDDQGAYQQMDDYNNNN